MAGGATEERAISRSRSALRQAGGEAQQGGTTRRPTGLFFPRGGIHNSPKIDCSLSLSTTTFSSIAVPSPHSWTLELYLVRLRHPLELQQFPFVNFLSCSLYRPDTSLSAPRFASHRES